MVIAATGQASDAGPERRTRQLVVLLVAAAVIAFLVLLLMAPARFMGLDDAYYLSIGRNILAGRGAFSAFGSFANLHGPVWPVLIAAPEAWFGIAAPAVAHLLVVCSGAAVIAWAGFFAWRIEPVAAPLAAATLLAFPFLVDLGTQMGLDVPAASLSLAYLAIGLVAVRRGSVGLGIAAGLVFAAAFLLKETALPLAPVPMLAGLVRRVPLERLLPASGSLLLAAVLGTSWWLAIFAGQLGTVYRLGTPAWTLVPLWVAAGLLAIAGLTAQRWLPRVAGGAVAGDGAPGWFRAAGWIGTFGWAVALTVVFARTPNGTGSSFLTLAQVSSTVSRWLPDLGLVLGVGLIGAALETVERGRSWWRGRAEAATTGSGAAAEPENATTGGDDADRAVDDLLIATIAGVPLALLVISVGEGPRHEIAAIALLVALGAAGWVRAIRRAITGDRLTLAAAGVGFVIAAALAALTLEPVVDRRLVVRLGVVALAAIAIGGLGWLVARRGTARRLGTVLVAVALAATVAAAAVVASVVVPARPSSLDQSRAAAVATVADWVRKNVPPGSPVVLAHLLSNEMALPIQGDYRLSLVNDEAGVRPAASAPLGVGIPGSTAADDWVALRESPLDVTTLDGYRASEIADRLRGLGPTTWIESELTGSREVSPIVDALAGAEGVRVAGSWSWPYGDEQLRTTAFEIDPDRLRFPNTVVLTTGALERVVTALERDRTSARAPAAALVARLKVADDDPAAAPWVARLRALAGA
jgi:hypothetical protein